MAMGVNFPGLKQMFLDGTLSQMFPTSDKGVVRLPDTVASFPIWRTMPELQFSEMLVSIPGFDKYEISGPAVRQISQQLAERDRLRAQVVHMQEQRAQRTLELRELAEIWLAQESMRP